MLRFTDDIAVLIESEEDLQNILTTMNVIFKNEHNIKINKSKTEILVCSRNKQLTVIKLDGNTFEEVMNINI